MNNVSIHTLSYLENSVIEYGGFFLEKYKIKFRVYGDLNKTKNIILINHPLSYGLNVITTSDKEGWWNEFCSDIARYFSGSVAFIIISLHEILENLSEEQKFTARDFSHIQYAVLKYLRVQNVTMALGGSLGGVTLTDFICAYPNYVKNAVIISASHKSFPNHLFLRELQESLIHKLGIHDADERVPVEVQLIPLFLYKSPEYFTDANREFLYKNIRSLSKNSWTKIKEMLVHYDLSQEISSIQSNIHLISCESDYFYPPSQQAEFLRLLHKHDKQVKHTVIMSRKGHDAFLSEQNLFSNHIMSNY